MHLDLEKKKAVLDKIEFQLRKKYVKKIPLQQVDNGGFGYKIMTKGKIKIEGRIH